MNVFHETTGLIILKLQNVWLYLISSIFNFITHAKVKQNESKSDFTIQGKNNYWKLILLLTTSPYNAITFEIYGKGKRGFFHCIENEPYFLTIYDMCHLLLGKVACFNPQGGYNRTA